MTGRGDNKMRSTHTIHNARYTLHLIGVDSLSELTQGHIIGRAVNILREMTPEEVDLAANKEINISGDADGELHQRRAKIITGIDEALRSNYTPRYTDDYGPTLSISRAEAAKK
jgi:hypothetical protein